MYPTAQPRGPATGNAAGSNLCITYGPWVHSADIWACVHSDVHGSKAKCGFLRTEGYILFKNQLDVRFFEFAIGVDSNQQLVSEECFNHKAILLGRP